MMVVYQDDIFLVVIPEKELDSKTDHVINRLRADVTIKENKYEHGCNRIYLLRYSISKEGVSSDQCFIYF